MQKTRLLAAPLACVAMLVASSVGPAGAALQAACALVTLTDVRAIVAAPVEVFEAGSSGPTTKGDQTISTCTYASPKTTRRATFSLLWAPPSEMTTTYTFYVKRNQERPRIKGDVLILASVRSGAGIDVWASSKLLAAVVAKVH